MSWCGRIGGCGGLVVALAVLAAVPARAQDGDGFLFRAPAGAISIRFGYDWAAADSEIFTFTTRQLTVSRRDFSSLAFAVDVDYALMRRLDARFSVGVSQSTTPSEFRDFVDNDRQPIEQTTTFTRVPLTASVKGYLLPPGRAVGHFAWVPSRYAPYLGAGGGVMWYRFQQDGDFIDFATDKVFPDFFLSQGWAPTLQLFAGTDVALSPRFAVNVEGRYHRAHAGLSEDFVGFDPINLSGFALTAGISLRY